MAGRSCGIIFPEMNVRHEMKEESRMHGTPTSLSDRLQLAGQIWTRSDSTTKTGIELRELLSRHYNGQSALRLYDSQVGDSIHAGIDCWRRME
jgi:hypothetical protein